MKKLILAVIIIILAVPQQAYALRPVSARLQAQKEHVFKQRNIDPSSNYVRFYNIRYIAMGSFFEFKGITKVKVKIAEINNKTYIQLKCLQSEKNISYTIQLDKNLRPIGIEKGKDSVSLAKILFAQGEIIENEWADYRAHIFGAREERNKRKYVSRAIAILKTKTEKSKKKWNESLAKRFSQEIESDNISRETTEKFLKMAGITTIIELHKKGLLCLHDRLYPVIAKYKLLNYNTRNRELDGTIIRTLRGNTQVWYFNGVRYTSVSSFFKFKGITEAEVTVDPENKTIQFKCVQSHGETITYTINLDKNLRPISLEEDKDDISFAKILHRQKCISEDEYSTYRGQSHEDRGHASRMQNIEKAFRIFGKENPDNWDKAIEEKLSAQIKKGKIAKETVIQFLKMANITQSVDLRKRGLHVLCNALRAVIVKEKLLRTSKTRTINGIKNCTLTQSLKEWRFYDVRYAQIDKFFKFKGIAGAEVIICLDPKKEKYVHLDCVTEKGGKIQYEIKLDRKIRPVGMSKTRNYITLAKILFLQCEITPGEYEEYHDNSREAGNILRRTKNLLRDFAVLKYANSSWDETVANRFMEEALSSEDHNVSKETATTFFKMAGAVRIIDLQRWGLWSLYSVVAKTVRENNLLDYGARRDKQADIPALANYLNQATSTPILPEKEAIAIWNEIVKGDDERRDIFADSLTSFATNAAVTAWKRYNPDPTGYGDLSQDRLQAAYVAVFEALAGNTWNQKKYPSLYEYLEDLTEEAMIKEAKKQKAPTYKEVSMHQPPRGSKRKISSKGDGREKPLGEFLGVPAPADGIHSRLSYRRAILEVGDGLAEERYDKDDLIHYEEKQGLAENLRQLFLEKSITKQLQQVLGNASFAIYITGSLGNYGTALRNNVDLNLMLVIDDSYADSLDKPLKALQQYLGGNIAHRYDSGPELLIGKNGDYINTLVNSNGFISLLRNDYQIGSPSKGFATVEAISANGSSSFETKARVVFHTTKLFSEEELSNAILVYASNEVTPALLTRQLINHLNTQPNRAFEAARHALETFARKQVNKNTDTINAEEAAFIKDIETQKNPRLAVGDISDIERAFLDSEENSDLDDPYIKSALAQRVKLLQPRTQINIDTAA